MKIVILVASGLAPAIVKAATPLLGVELSVPVAAVVAPPLIVATATAIAAASAIPVVSVAGSATPVVAVAVAAAMVGTVDGNSGAAFSGT